MNRSLYIYELNVRSSYAKNIELAATNDDFDTVQWWINADDCWRIRTYDVDSDIHVHHVPKSMSIDEIDGLMRKRYSEIMVGRYDFSSVTQNDSEIIISKMKSGSPEVDPSGNFAFWNHDGRRYASKSRPGAG